MKLGTFMMPLHPPTRHAWETLREDREAIILADRLGYAEAFVGEHSTDLAENVTSCLMFLCSLAFETRQIKLGSGTLNMPNTHPAAVAANVAMIDHLLQGRFIMGISPGGLMSDAEVFGSFGKDRLEMFVEAIDMVLALWTSPPPYDLKGKFWEISTRRTLVEEIGQGLLPKPLQRPYPPVMVTAVAPHSKGLVSAAARGWKPISANFLLPKWVATHWPQYAEGCRSAGLPASPADWRVAKSVFVADDLATAREYAIGPQSPYRHYYRSIVTKMKKSGRAGLFKADPNASDDSVTLDGVLDELVIWGTPDKVIDDLARFRAQVGPFGTLLYAGKDWVDPALAKRSMVLLAEKVRPALQGRNMAA